MSQPFGLALGQTPGGNVAEYHVQFKAVPKPHPSLKSYSGTWSPERGLTELVGMSERFEDDPMATRARSIYQTLSQQLEAVYGKPEINEWVEDHAIYPSERDFVQGLLQRERAHFRFWGSEAKPLSDQLEQVMLSVIATDYDTSVVHLIYQAMGGQALESLAFGQDSL